MAIVQKTMIKKQKFMIQCVGCKKPLSNDCNDRPFRTEIFRKICEDDYDKITRCPRCLIWNGVYK
ncbi:MAG TPA: hypothetical protein DEP23_09140 [Ruminococcaceae bacterium]|nr:hypothetical protein [Oscillospiraceae bacterium]